MIRIQESKPYSADIAPSENYGQEYMARISAKTARALCGAWPMPRIGHEIVVAINTNRFDRPRLFVANISGAYFVRCAGVAIAQWPEVFRVSVCRKKTVQSDDDASSDIEHCDKCSEALESSQIGLCDSCQEE